MTDPVYKEAKATCRNEQCPNNGVTFTITVGVNADNSVYVFCGKCRDENGRNNRITDLEMNN